MIDLILTCKRKNPVEYGDPQTTLCKRYLEGHCRATSKNPCRNSHVLFDTKRVEDIAGGAARQTLASVSLHVEYMRGNIKASRDDPGWRLSLCYNSNCTPSLDAIVVDNKDLNTAMYMMEMQFELQRSLDNLPRAVPTVSSLLVLTSISRLTDQSFLTTSLCISWTQARLSILLQNTPSTSVRRRLILHCLSKTNHHRDPPKPR